MYNERCNNCNTTGHEYLIHEMCSFCADQMLVSQELVIEDMLKEWEKVKNVLEQNGMHRAGKEIDKQLIMWKTLISSPHISEQCISCPFCGEIGFNPIGLKIHWENNCSSLS